MKSVAFDGQPQFPSKIVCVGRNYVEHIEELGNEVPEEMVLFFKPNAAISDELLVFRGEPIHFEGEIALGVFEGRFRYVGFALDLTKRQLQSRLKAKGLPWERCKAFEGSMVASPFVELPETPDELELELWVDDQLQQRGGLSLMINGPEAILAEVGQLTALEDFDIVLTGTPKGVGVLVAGSRYTGLIKSGGKTLVSHTWTAR